MFVFVGVSMAQEPSPLPAGSQPQAFSAAHTSSSPQDSSRLTLEQCYQLGQANYPLSRQHDLIRQSKEYSVENISKGIYPQVNINGSATYQSDVTKVSFPPINGLNIEIPTVPKNQYRIYGEVSQTLTDFGINKKRRDISEINSDIQEQNLNTELYSLKDRINQLYFGIILLDGQIEQNELSKKDIQTGIDRVQAAVNNGTDFRSSVNKLKASLLETEQRSIDFRASRRAYADMLSLFINQPVTESTVLVKPDIPNLTDSINRPELKGYDLQVQSYLQEYSLNKKNNYPHLEAFFQGGLGQPSPVNVLSTQLGTYYITGLRLNWNFGNLYTYKKDQLINKNNQEIVLSQRNTFLFNTSVTLRQENAQIRKYRDLIRADDEIVQLRSSVKQTSTVQLQNGVLSANDYLLDINAEALARQQRVVHEIQLLMSQYDHKTTSGN
jgi:outer membrane protein TolC